MSFTVQLASGETTSVTLPVGLRIVTEKRGRWSPALADQRAAAAAAGGDVGAFPDTLPPAAKPAPRPRRAREPEGDPA